MRHTWDEWVRGGRRVALAGHDVFVRVEGAGPTLLLFHGFPTSSFDWAPVVDRLRGRYRVVAFDFVGFGASSKPALAYDFELQVRVVEALVAELRITRALVVAHDFGVTVAQELLAREREGRATFELAGVVFLNGGLSSAVVRPILAQRVLAGPLGPLLGPRLFGRRVFVRSMKRIIRRFERFDADEHWKAVSSDHGVERIPAIIQYMHERARHRLRWEGALRDARPPLAFVWGLDDPISGAHVLDWVRTLTPRAEHVPLPGLGHYPQLEDDAAVADAIARFATAHLGG